MPLERATNRRSGFAFLLVVALLGPSSTLAAPHRPQRDDIVLERLPVVLDTTARELRQLRARAADRPDDPTPALALAERYFALGQTTQDPRYIGYARAAVQRWWADPNAPAAAIVLRAAIKQNRHEFGAALADLDLVLARDPGSPRAWLGRATILLAQGKPVESLASCQRLLRVAAPIVGAICRAAAAARLGDARAAFAMLDVTLARGASLDPAIEVWAHNDLAEIALLLGDPEAAQRQLREALRLEPQDAFTINALADLLLDQGRADEALAVLGDDMRHDGKLLRSAIALRMLGRPRWRENAALLEARFAAANSRGDSLHLREDARFRLALADDPAGALQVAQRNWRDQREPQDARLLLESALAAQAPDAAEPVLRWLDETGLADPRLECALRRLRGGEG
jgi:tetratricopeptide (TPR) repeat protein